MIVKIVLELRDIDFYDGRLDWNLPVLPRVGEVFSASLLARAFDMKQVFDRLSPEDQEIWEEYKSSFRKEHFTKEELERFCFMKYLDESEWLVLEEVWWEHSDELGPYPLLTVRERKLLHEPFCLED